MKALKGTVGELLPCKEEGVQTMSQSPETTEKQKLKKKKLHGKTTISQVKRQTPNRKKKI